MNASPRPHPLVRFGRWLARLARRLWIAQRRWIEDDGYLLSAAISYYTTIALVPLVWTLITVLGAIFGLAEQDVDARARVLDALGTEGAPELRQAVSDVLDATLEKAPQYGVLSFAVFLFAAGTIFLQLDRAFDIVWNAERDPVGGFLDGVRRLLLDRLRSFLGVLFVAALVLIVFVTSLTLSVVEGLTGETFGLEPWVFQQLNLVAATVLNGLVVTVVYRWLPRTDVRWSAAFQGGAVTTVLWTIGRELVAAFVIGERYSAYGIVGTVLVMMLWFFFATSVLLLGAEYTQVVQQEAVRAEEAREKAQRP